MVFKTRARIGLFVRSNRASPCRVRPWVAPIRVGARSRPEGGAAAPTESNRRQLGGVIEVSVSRCFSAFQQATLFTDTLGMSLVIPCPVHDSLETFNLGNGSQNS